VAISGGPLVSRLPGGALPESSDALRKWSA